MNVFPAISAHPLTRKSPAILEFGIKFACLLFFGKMNLNQWSGIMAPKIVHD
jgi:hypothetical protein